MQIEESTVTKLTIRDVPNLDPVAVIVEDFGPGQGKITITCFGEAWSHYWSHMGENTTLADFFCKCDEGYIAGKLKTGINSEVEDDDEDKLTAALRAQIIQDRRAGEYGTREARELWDDAGYVEWYNRADLCYKVFGDEWYYMTPQKPNHEYVYLCRIIKAVQAAFQMHKQ